MSQTIPSGIYFGFTKTEMKTELERYKAAVKTSGSELLSASQNGQSYSFGPRNDMSLSEWQIAIQDALSFFEEACPPPSSDVVVRFGCR